VKLGQYRGDTCLETFPAKFENLSGYLHRNEADRLFHLCASLEGPAGQILWDAGPQTSVDNMIRLLRARFGTDRQVERFRAELQGRKCKKDESLHSLYNGICRLVAFACPGPSNTTTQVVERDSFLDALDNNSLRVRILQHESQTLDDALRIACRLEAYDKSADPTSASDNCEDGRSRERSRHVRTVAPCPSNSRDSRKQATVEQLAQMKSTFEKIVQCGLRVFSN
jgi:hypothetical protein